MYTNYAPLQTDHKYVVKADNVARYTYQQELQNLNVGPSDKEQNYKPSSQR